MVEARDEVGRKDDKDEVEDDIASGGSDDFRNSISSSCISKAGNMSQTVFLGSEELLGHAGGVEPNLDTTESKWSGPRLFSGGIEFMSSMEGKASLVL